MGLDIGKAFTYVFDDPKWLAKVGIGGLVVLCAIIASITIIGGILVGAILLGYCVQMMRNVIAGAQYPLPEWTNVGEFFSDGIKAVAVVIVMALPVIVVSIILVLPGQILSSVSSARGEINPFGVLLSLAGSCLEIPLGIVTGLLVPIALGRYATTRNIGASLDFGQIFATLRANIGTYLIVWLVGGLASGIIGSLGAIACGIGLVFTSCYAALVTYHLYAQAYLISQGAQPGAYGQSYGQARPF